MTRETLIAAANYPPSICKIVLQMTVGKYDDIRPLSVLGNVSRIESALKDAGVYEDWMHGYLWEKSDLAKETL